MTRREKILILILILAIAGFTTFFLKNKRVNVPIALKTLTTAKEKLSEKVSLSPDSKTTSLQQINNVGYSFYLGQIDYPDAPIITDDTKNKITQIIYKANFPKTLLKNIAIIIVNTLAVSPDQYIKTPSGKIKVPDFSPDFMTGGGIYSQNTNQMSLIFINKTVLNNLTSVLTHELGHHISRQLTSEEWAKYYQLRKIPSNTPRRGQNWMLSPEEDFAEVYKYIYTGLKPKTAYGLLLPNDWFLEKACSKIHDDLFNSYKDKYYADDPFALLRDMDKIENAIASNTQLQNCRKEVMSHPEKYPDEVNAMGGMPYYSVVDQETKEFITKIINRLK